MSTLHETATDSLEALDFEVPCESRRCQVEWNMGSHAADWAVIYTCGCVTNLCDQRVQWFTVERELVVGHQCPRCWALSVDIRAKLPIRQAH